MNCKTCHLPVDKDKGNWVETCDSATAETTAIEHDECEGKRLRAKFQQTGRITTQLWMSASLNVMRAGLHQHCVDDEIKDAVERVKIDVKRFEVEVWFGGAASATEIDKWEGKRLIYPRKPSSLQTLVEDHKRSTLTDKLMGIDVTTQCMAGRVGIELEDDRARITLVAAEREQTPRMGIMGLDGTEDDFRRMINCVREGWKYLNLKPSKGW